MFVDCYPDRLLQDAVSVTEMKDVMRRERIQLKKIRYRLTFETTCWYCDEKVVIRHDGTCPSCGEKELPF